MKRHKSGLFIDRAVCKQMSAAIRVRPFAEKIVSLPYGWNFLIELIDVCQNATRYVTIAVRDRLFVLCREKLFVAEMINRIGRGNVHWFAQSKQFIADKPSEQQFRLARGRE